MGRPRTPNVPAWSRSVGGAAVGALTGGRPARDAPRLAGASVNGLRAPAWSARERRWVRNWSITDAWVMNAMIRTIAKPRVARLAFSA